MPDAPRSPSPATTFEDFRHLIGDEGWGDLEDLVQRVIRRTSFKKIARWRIGDPLEWLIGPIVLSTLVEAIKPLQLTELRRQLQGPEVQQREPDPQQDGPDLQRTPTTRPR